MISRIKLSLLKGFLRRPVYLVLGVTSRCNSRCKHCFFHKQLNSTVRELSFDEIEGLSRQLGALLEIDLSGGEPFMRDDLADIYKVFVKNNKVETFAIPTNGILTDQVYAQTLKILQYGGAKHVTVSLSLDGPRDIHDETRGVKCYDQVFRTYEALAPLKNKYKRFSLRAGTTITDMNYRSIPALHDELARSMPGLDFHDFEIVRGDIPDRRFALPPLDALKQLRPVIFGIWDQYNDHPGGVQSKVASRARQTLFNGYIRILETQKQLWPCLAGRVHCVVDYKGDVFCCELLPKIGNIREDKFADVWRSARACRTRAAIRAKDCFCTNSCFHTISLLFDQAYWARFLL
jgi:MoaA/NifB/PqqE/SkfB family radical SAM enzyme